MTVVACTYYHEEFDICLTLHGDDFMSVSSIAAQEWLDKHLAHHFDVKLVGRLGLGCQTEGRFLKRLIRWSPDGYTWQANPKQITGLIHTLNVDTCKSTPSPGTKATRQTRRDAGELLDGTRGTSV